MIPPPAGSSPSRGGEEYVIETVGSSTVGVARTGHLSIEATRIGAPEIKDPSPGVSSAIDGDPSFEGDRGVNGNQIVGQIAISRRPRAPTRQVQSGSGEHRAGTLNHTVGSTN